MPGKLASVVMMGISIKSTSTEVDFSMTVKHELTSHELNTSDIKNNSTRIKEENFLDNYT